MYVIRQLCNYVKRDTLSNSIISCCCCHQLNGSCVPDFVAVLLYLPTCGHCRCQQASAQLSCRACLICCRVQIAGATTEAFAEKSKQKKKRGAAKLKKAVAPVDMEVDIAQSAGCNTLRAQPTVAPHEMVFPANMSVPHCQQIICCLCHTGRVVFALLSDQVKHYRPFTLQPQAYLVVMG